MRRSRLFAGMLAALFTFAAVSCANNVGGDPSGSQGNSANPSGSQDASSSSEPSGPQNSPGSTGPSGSQDLPGSTDKESEDLLGPDSKGGHLSLEAVEGGIKVTVRVLEGDIPEGKKLTSMNNFYIEETSTRIRLDLNKDKFLASAGDDRENELSGIFPFTKADTDYKFEYVFDMQDNGNTFYPYTKESAACKATSTGLSLDEYFDYDYAPYKATVMVNADGIMSIDKDVSQFIKKNDAEIFISGDVVSGVYNWSDADWCAGWESSIRNYEQSGWRYRIDYKELFEGNADLGIIVLQNSNAVRTLCKRDTWFVNGDYKFSFPGIKTGFSMVIDYASKGEEASSEMFKAPLLDNPFKGKTFNQSINQNNYGGYVINFVDDTTAIFSQIYNGSESEVFAEYAYEVDSSEAKMYLETQKVNIDGTLCNRKESMELLRSRYPEKTDEQLNIMLSQVFARKEIGYICTKTGEISFYGIMYDNPEDYLVNNFEYIPIYEYYDYESDDLYLWLAGSGFVISSHAQDYKSWTAISVNDGKITYKDKNFTETLNIQYEFKTGNVLTITYGGQSYDLLRRNRELIGTLSDGSTTPDEGTTDSGTKSDAPETPGNTENDAAEEETVKKIENTYTGGASDITHNDDGSITGVSSAANSGQPLIVYINSDKTSVASGKTVKVVFDFAVESWSDDTLLPKFVVAAGLESEGWDLKGSAPAYRDATAATGSIEVPLVLTAESDVVKVQFNAWEWPGSETDSIKVTIKTIDVE